MTDKIDEIVDRTIKHTRELLAADAIEWSVARVGLERIGDGLAAEAPDHPALVRLRDFVVEQDRSRRKQ